MSRVQKIKSVDEFSFMPGRILAGKYQVVRKLGEGWESEVYLVKERRTGIDRTAKVFFPQRNLNGTTVNRSARKLHKLRNCSAVIHYHTEETITFKREPVNFLISEYVEGEPLKDFLARQRGKRLHVFQALHLLHALAVGIEEIHNLREYHGDLHHENILVRRVGLGFDLKLLDLFHWNAPKKENIEDDVCDMIKIFYDALGGQKFYSKQPPEVKAICCGLKKSLILKKFRTAGQLRKYLEHMRWA